jgi:hypothetical protein
LRTAVVALRKQPLEWTEITLDEFAAMTRRIIASDGFDDYLPTVCYPDSRRVKTLVGVPPEMKPEEPALEWAVEGAENGEEFLVAFKVDDRHFKIVRQVGSYSEDETSLVD